MKFKSNFTNSLNKNTKKNGIIVEKMWIHEVKCLCY